MKNQFYKIYLLILFCAYTFVLFIHPVEAQSQLATPTILPSSTTIPTVVPQLPTLTPTITPEVVQLVNPDTITFSQLGRGELQLNGPYDSAVYYFTIPADWALKDGIELNLFFGVSTNDATLQDRSDLIVVGSGTLTVLLNNTVLLVKPLDLIGETEIKVEIPREIALSNNGNMYLEIVLESSALCRVVGMHTSVYVHSRSYFYLPHDLVQPSTSLLNFPKPIIQASIFPDSALMVIPDEPSASEMRAALTVAAGLGKFSWNQLKLETILLNDLTEDLSKTNLILVGKASSLPMLDKLNLPNPSKNGQFDLSGGGLDDGLIEMINSPWSNSHVILVVSANTDAGVVKAAQALSSGVIRPNQAENWAVIEQVNDLPVAGSQAVDQSLADLGYDFYSFRSLGESEQEYIFNIPVGSTIGTDAYFDLVYGHSALIDYAISQIVVLLNNQPIGSIRMDDSTAALSTNHAKIMLPPAAILPGENRLSVRVTLESTDECVRPDSQGLWVNIWPESLIHLPLLPLTYDPLIAQDLAKYPAPFIYESTLKNTAFILERSAVDSWRNAVQIASFLGSQARGTLFQLSAFYGDELPSEEKDKYHFLVIGRPSYLPILAELNNSLPAPFIEGSNSISEKENFQVVYRIPADSPMGYIEMVLSPWNSEKIVLAILGNTIEGVNWAAEALVDSKLRWRLGGSLVVVHDKQIIVSSIRYTEQIVSPAALNTTVVPELIASLPASDAVASVPDALPAWLLPVLVGSVVLIAIIVVFAIIQNRSKLGNRKIGDSLSKKDELRIASKK